MKTRLVVGLVANASLHGVANDKHQDQDEDSDGGADKDHNQGGDFFNIGLTVSAGHH